MSKRWKDETGSFTIFSIFIITGILILAGIFINVTITYLNINFSKKALEESVRVRALAVDIPLKESEGIVEVIHYPHTGNKMGVTRPTSMYGGIIIPGVESPEYKDKVDYAERNARLSLINSVTGSFNLTGEKIIKMNENNICYDVQPLPKKESEVTFKCALKGQDGKIYTIEANIPVMGYEEGINRVIDDLQSVKSDTAGQDSRELRVSNVVFGAAMIAPKSFITEGLKSLGLKDQPPTVIYSVAYPQIDECYGSYCQSP